MGLFQSHIQFIICFFLSIEDSKGIPEPVIIEYNVKQESKEPQVIQDKPHVVTDKVLNERMYTKTKVDTSYSAIVKGQVMLKKEFEPVSGVIVYLVTSKILNRKGETQRSFNYIPQVERYNMPHSITDHYGKFEILINDEAKFKGEKLLFYIDGGPFHEFFSQSIPPRLPDYEIEGSLGPLKKGDDREFTLRLKPEIIYLCRFFDQYGIPIEGVRLSNTTKKYNHDNQLYNYQSDSNGEILFMNRKPYFPKNKMFDFTRSINLGFVHPDYHVKWVYNVEKLIENNEVVPIEMTLQKNYPQVTGIIYDIHCM